MKIHFEYIKLRNFGSYGNGWTIYNFNEGLFNLFGAIGQGKSSILSALFFNLYGSAFKVNIGELVNQTNDSNMETESCFIVGNDRYVLQRGLKPNILEVYKNTVPMTKLSKKKFIQEEIDKILGMDATMFKSIVGLSVQNNKPFFTMTKGEKRLMLENLFGLSLFADMAKIVKNEIASLKTDVEVLRRTMTIYEQSLVESSNQIKNMEKINSETNANKQKEIDDLRNEVETITLKAKDHISNVELLKRSESLLVESISDKDKRIKNKSLLTKEKSELEKKIVVIQHQIDTLNNTDVCHSCLTKVTEEHKEKHTKVFQEELSTISPLLEEKNKLLNEIKEVELSISEEKNKLTEIKFKMKTEMELLKVCSSRVKELERKVNEKTKGETVVDVQSIRDSFDRKVEEYSKVKGSIAFKQEEIKVDNLLTDILSDNGVKAYFMEKMLPWLNYKINEYLDRFDFTARITINSTLSETIETLSGITKERSYHSFSGGERKIIDVSVWLAFIDSVKMFLNWNANLLFIDELFDEGTDGETIEKIIGALRLMVNDKKMHITLISHKNPDVRFDGKYLARKIGGFSKLETMT